VDFFTLTQSFNNVDWPVTNAAIGHRNQGIVVCLQHEPDVQFDGPIVTNNDPVAAPAKHFPGKVLAVELPSRDDPDAAMSAGRLSYDLKWHNLKADHKN
jgi:hypothetical protein